VTNPACPAHKAWRALPAETSQAGRVRVQEKQNNVAYLQLTSRARSIDRRHAIKSLQDEKCAVG
jgi:hypothetical protein